MKNRISIILIYFIVVTSVNAQTISGNLSLLPNQTIQLEGFNGFKTYPISNTSDVV